MGRCFKAPLQEAAVSLEVLDTIASLLTVAIVSAAAVAALIQLRHMRATNLINSMLAIGENINSAAFNDALELVRRNLQAALADPAFRDYETALSRNLPPPEVSPQYVSLRRAAVLVGNTYEELGYLVKSGLVDRALFLDRYCWKILGAWKRLESYTAFGRGVIGTNKAWELFEYLTVLAEDWLQSHPTVYPKGVRRIKLHSPWPAPPPAEVKSPDR